MKKICISSLLLLLPLANINATSCPLAEVGIGNINIPFSNAVYVSKTDSVYKKGVTCFYNAYGSNIVFNKPKVYANAIPTGSSWQPNPVFPKAMQSCYGDPKNCAFSLP